MNFPDQSFQSRESMFSVDFSETQDEIKDLLFENKFLKEQIEIITKKHDKEKFEFENKIKAFEREIIKLKSTLNSANEMLEVYKAIDKQNENSEIREIIEKLKFKNDDLEETNLLLKKENTDIINELDHLKSKIKSNHTNKNQGIYYERVISENKEVEKSYNKEEKNNMMRICNSPSSTNQSSNLNVNLHNQFSNENISYKEKIENDIRLENDLNKHSNNPAIENKENNFKFHDVNKIAYENITENKYQNSGENEVETIERENIINESDSIASDISFTSKNTNQLKDIFLKIKKEKNRIYDNAVELMTENEYEIKVLKDENEDLKYAFSKNQEEYFRLKQILKLKFNFDLDENGILNSNDIYDLNNYNYSTSNSKHFVDYNLPASNVENLLEAKRCSNEDGKFNNIDNNDILNLKKENTKEIPNNEINSDNVCYDEEYSLKNNHKNNDKLNHDENINNNQFNYHGSNKKLKTEDDKMFSSEKYNNSFEYEKNEMRSLIENLELKLLESSKGYEEQILKLKQDLENMELEKNHIQQELETFQTNKKDLVENLDFYSVTVRTLQEQNEKLEDNLKIKIDHLVEDKKHLEKIINKKSDQVMLLEKEKKEIQDLENKKYKELDEKYKKDKDQFEAKSKEITNRYIECLKEIESLKKENELLKEGIKKMKNDFDKLNQESLDAKEKKEKKINSINENFKNQIEKMEKNFSIKIEKDQEKIKNLYSIIEKNIEKINLLTKETIKNVPENGKNCSIKKKQVSKLRRTKSLLDKNFNEIKFNFDIFYDDFDLQLTSKNNEYKNEIKNKQSNDVNNNYLNDMNFNNDEKLISPINDEKSHNHISVHTPEFDLNASPFEENFKILDSENRKENEFLELYGIDTKKKHNSILKSFNSFNFYNNEITGNTLVHAFLNENQNENNPNAFALEDVLNNDNHKLIENNDQNKTQTPDSLIIQKEPEKQIKKSYSYNRKINGSLIRRKSSMNIFKKLNRENIKKKLKNKRSKNGIGNLDSTQQEDNLNDNTMRQKFDLMMIKKEHEKEIEELKSKLFENEKKIKKLDEESHNIDQLLIMKELKEENLILRQEDKNFKEELQVLKSDLDALEATNNNYINKLKIDVELAEDIAARAKFTVCQLNFEKDTEILKYRNYCKRLKTKIRDLEVKLEATNKFQTN